MTKTKVMNWLQKNTMTLILVLVFAFFAWRTEGKILMPNNISNLIAQNAYVFILATGMLLCILTGGNIDLAVGSVVCFAGAVGALLMAGGMNLWAAVAIMLAIGLVVGGLQAFCIAYIKVPPFIPTLAGQLIFRGLSNVVLGGKTCSVNNAQFLKIFGGGAECYVPDLLGGNGINLLCLVVGIAACVLLLTMTFRTRMIRVKKGYAVEKWLPVIGRMVIISAVCIFFFYKLAQYKGIPTALDGKEMSAKEIILALNEIGGKNGIGLLDIVENRLVGMKDRGVYETPGGTILYFAHEQLEMLTVDRDTLHVKQKLAVDYADLIYNGKWYSPLQEALTAFANESNKYVTGTVKLKLYKGNIIPAGTTSPYSLYSENLVTFDESDYDQKQAEGFINLWGLPTKVQALREQGKL